LLFPGHADARKVLGFRVGGQGDSPNVIIATASAVLARGGAAIWRTAAERARGAQAGEGAPADQSKNRLQMSKFFVWGASEEQAILWIAKRKSL
jgi:hypothetical protein